MSRHKAVVEWHTFESDKDGVFIDVPEDGQDILVTFNPSFKFVENESHVCSVTFWENVGDGGYLEGFMDCIEITEDMAWMPFPEPYKGEEQPTTDIVEVVRCKDCERSQLVDWKRYCTGGFSTAICAVVDDDDYCSNAERKMND